MSDEIVLGAPEVEPTEMASPVDAGVTPEEPTTTQPAAPEASSATPVAPPAKEEAMDEFERAMRALDMGARNEKSSQHLIVGEVISGTVMRVDREGALVDVGAKSEGIIRPDEISREPGANIEEIVHVGEVIRVYVMRTDDGDGRPELSKKRADFEQAWIKVEQAKETGEVISAFVQARVKGGLTVDLGIRGFVPASHVGNGNLKNNLEKYVGQSLPLKVIEVDKDRRKVVLSHRLAIQEEREAKSAATKASLAPEQIRTGVVRRIVPYGAFIDLGGVDGLLHITEMSWTRINDPKEVLREGQEIDVMVLGVDLSKDRVSLGLRQILPDPWTEVPSLYANGDVVMGKITRVGNYGAFVLIGGVEGIIPHSELPRHKASRGVVVPNSGDDVEVKILDLRPEERKMKLSMRALQVEEPPAPVEAAPASTQSAPAKETATTAGSGAKRARKDRDRDREQGEPYTRYVQEDEPRFTIGEAIAAAKRKSERRERRRQEEEPEDMEVDVDVEVEVEAVALEVANVEA